MKTKQWTEHEREAEANARLIAAAPDLLVACKAIVESMRGARELMGKHQPKGKEAK